MDANEQFERGFGHFQEYRFDEALNAFDRAIALSPDLARAYTGRGYGHNVNGDCEKAIADFTKAIQLDPGDSDAWKGRADSRQLFGDFKNSLSDYDEAIRLFPHVADYFHRRGDAYCAVGNLDMAIHDYRRAISLDSQNPISHYYLASLLAQRQAYADAVHHYNEAIRIDPDHLEEFVYAQYAWILATCPDERCRDGEKAIRMAIAAGVEPDAEEWSLGILAAAHAANGNYTEATKLQRRACETAEGDRQTLQRQRLEFYASGKPLITSSEP